MRWHETRMKAFISYSHADKSYCDQLNKHLAVLKRDELLDSWHDQEILPGGEIDLEISGHLGTCQLFLPLVSSDFFASGYCYDKEMAQAIAQQQVSQTVIVPIVLRPCDWQASVIGKYKGLPYDGKDCIAVSKWIDKDEAFLNIVQGLRQFLTANKAKEEKGRDATASAPSAAAPKETVSRPRYRVKREFDRIEIGEFREQAFQNIRTYFDACVKGINEIDGIRARLFSAGANSFSCTIVNKGLGPRGTAFISVHAGNNRIGGFGDIWYSFSENSPNSANGILNVESDGFNLFLKPSLMFSVLQGHEENNLMSPETAADIIWRELVQQAGVIVD